MAISGDTIYNVKNRSTSICVYSIPELGVRREFQPGEIKRITFNELEKLTYQPGGRELLQEFLQIGEEVVTYNLNVKRELEYDMSEVQIRDLLLRGSLDSFLDALDFAPIGVIDLMKKMSVSLPLTDYRKRKALKDKTGFDVDSAIRHEEEEKAELEQESQEKATPRERRVKVEEASSTPQRRTTPDYKVISVGDTSEE